MKFVIKSIVVAVLTMSFVASAKTVSVRGRGEELDYQSAVQSALAQSISQVRGVTIAESRRIVSENQSVSAYVSADKAKRSAAFSATATKTSSVDVSGCIESFRIVSESQNPTTHKWTVVVDAQIVAPYRAPGLDPDNRRRLAVVPFRSVTGDSLSWYGQAESSAGWAHVLAERLNARLTQTRKFTMVDRKFDAEINEELARLSGQNASKADAVRLNQKLGTDYLVVGDVRFFPVVAPGVNPLTGQALPVTSQKFAEVSYRVLLAPTGQLKWADTVVLDAMEFTASDVASFVTASAEGAAMRIADAMMANILPFEIVGKTANGTLIVGEGGKSLAEGERFNVFALGEEVSDTRTGEVLDQIEEPVGTVEIVRVSEKMSYARVVEGDATKMTVGARLRRPKVEAAAPAAPPPPVTTTIRGNGTGGVVAPF